MSRPKVLVTHSETPIAAIELLQKRYLCETIKLLTNHGQCDFSCDVTICEGLPTPSREEILAKSNGMDGILWATHCALNAEALDAAGRK